MFRPPTDELFSQQWYLQNRGNYDDGLQDWLYRKGGDAKVVDAWKILDNHQKDWGAKRVKIAIIDGGFDLNHPDLKDKIVAKKDFDFGSSDYPAAQPFDLFEEASFYKNSETVFSNGDHGTSCAGIALAASNNIGIVGVAPNAGFIPIILKLNFFSPRKLRKALQFAMDAGADIISCSLGLPRKAINYDMYRSIHECATQGRNGKGCIICFAAGNDYQFLKAGAIATHPDLMAIGASTSEDDLAPYSNRSKNLSIIAPGGFENAIKMVTSDVGELANGIAAGKGPKATPYYRMNATGTSFACPLVAGVAALVLEANPDLTAQEVKHVIQDTANKVGDLRDYDKQGHSTKYGYGRINAANAVLKAMGKSTRRSLSRTYAPDLSLHEDFKMDLGMTMQGSIPANSEGIHLKKVISIAPLEERKTLIIEIEPAALPKEDCFICFIQKNEKAGIMTGSYLAQSQSNDEDNYTILTLPNIESGDYFLFIQQLRKQPFGFVKGGGGFQLTWHLEGLV